MYCPVPLKVEGMAIVKKGVLVSIAKQSHNHLETWQLLARITKVERSQKVGNCLKGKHSMDTERISIAENATVHIILQPRARGQNTASSLTCLFVRRLSHFQTLLRNAPLTYERLQSCTDRRPTTPRNTHQLWVQYVVMPPVTCHAQEWLGMIRIQYK